MKKSMSWVDIRVWIAEQGSSLASSFVDNLYLVGEAIVLRLRCRDGQYRELVIEPGKRISFTKRKLRAEPTPAQTHWRNLVRGCRVLGVEQLGEERVVILRLRCGDKQRDLIAELLPRGVIAVVEDGRIVALTSSRRMRDRVLVCGAKYVPPPSRKPLAEASVEELAELLRVGKDLVRGLIKGWGLPPEVAETVLHDLGIDPGTSVESIDRSLVERIRSRVIEFIDAVCRSPRPCIVVRGGEPEGFYPFEPPTRIREAEVLRFESFDEAIDEYFAMLSARMVEVPPEVRKEIERVRRAIEGVEKSIEARERELEELRRVLGVVESRYADLEALHEGVRRVVKELGWSRVPEVVKGFGIALRSLDPSKGVYVVEVDGVGVEMSVRKGFIEVYSELRKRVSELEKDLARSREELERLKRELERLEEEARSYVASSVAKLARKVEWFERFHWTVTSHGFLVLGGRDASQNIALLRRYAEPHDIVMHADVRGASAVVIKTGGKEVPEQDIREAATLAACYSKAWKAGRRCVDVFWVKREQVSLSAPPGEYLPKGSFMVYGKRNYVRCVELRLGIGIEVVEGGFYRVFVGPEHLVRDRCVAYMVIEPGEQDPSSLAKDFLNRVARAGHQVVARSVDVNEVAMRIPGRSRMVKFVAREESEV